jgi:hypothetical protein
MPLLNCSSLLLLLTFGVSQQAIGVENWSTCKKSSECAVTDDSCYTPQAINKKFLKMNEQNNEKVRPLISCLEYKGPRKEAYVALCKKMKCELELK